MKLLGSIVAAAALIGAFLINDVPKELRVGAPDHAAAANAVRVVLLIVAVVIVAVAISKGSGLWLDTLLFAAVGLAIIALVKTYADARPENSTPQPSTVTFRVPFNSLNVEALPQKSRAKGSDVVLLLLRKEQGANGAVTFSSHRYKAKLVAGLPPKPQETVAVSITRGNDDEQSAGFATDLQQLQTIYVLPKAA